MTDVWFYGPVADAVKTVTQKNLVFLVFVYDDSEESKQLESILNEEKVALVIKEKTVALKMQKDSEDAKLFSQLYPISKVPIVYFILQGTIKDFGIEGITSNQIIEKIRKILPVNPSPNDTTSNNLPSTTQAKEKLDEIRKKRAEEEKAKARENEIKRREEGRLAQETRQSLQEKQNKIYLEKVKKEKRENEEYKRKVKEQIARDRENQIAATKAEKRRLEEKRSKAAKGEPTTTTTESSKSYHDHSNLNIKQLDGSSLRHSFSSSDTLASVSQWIDSARTDGDMPFKLFVQFPNRNFDIGDEQRTLLELKLCPSGTLIMKPIKNASTAYSGSSGASNSGGWMNYLYSASDVIYNTVSSVGTSVASYLVIPTNAPEPGRRLGGPSSTALPSSSAPSNINTLNNARFKKDDDDRQTYNGNSVNQE